MSGYTDLRRALNTLDYTNTSRFEELSAENLLRLCRACWASDWDVYPDQLSEKQVAAILAGTLTVPEFEETDRGLQPLDPT